MMQRMRDNKGVTLYEMLAALAISTILIGTIMLLTVYSQKGVASAASRADITRESRTVIDQIVKTVRNETSTPTSQYEGRGLRLDFVKTNDTTGEQQSTGNYISFLYTPGSDGNGLFEMERRQNGQTVKQVLSKHVADMKMVLSGDKKKIDITLKMQMPNHQFYSSSTTVYFPRLIIT